MIILFRYGLSGPEFPQNLPELLAQSVGNRPDNPLCSLDRELSNPLSTGLARRSMGNMPLRSPVVARYRTSVSSGLSAKKASKLSITS